MELNNWTLIESTENPYSTYLIQNNIKVVKAILPKGEVRCFIEVINKDGKTIECLSNHHTSLIEALKEANTYLNIGV